MNIMPTQKYSHKIYLIINTKLQHKCGGLADPQITYGDAEGYLKRDKKYIYISIFHIKNISCLHHQSQY